MKPSERILLVSEAVPLDMFGEPLEARGFQVVSVDSREKAAAELDAARFDLVIIDLLNSKDGVDFVSQIRRSSEFDHTFVMTLADWGTGEATLALSLGADAYEPKPIDADQLVKAVERLLRQRAARQQAG